MQTPIIDLIKYFKNVGITLMVQNKEIYNEETVFSEKNILAYLA